MYLNVCIAQRGGEGDMRIDDVSDRVLQFCSRFLSYGGDILRALSPEQDYKRSYVGEQRW